MGVKVVTKAHSPGKDETTDVPLHEDLSRKADSDPIWLRAGDQLERQLLLVSRNIALKAFNGHYVSTNKHHYAFLEAGWADFPQGWENFTVEDAGDGKISFKACNGKYVGADLNPARDNQLKACADRIGEWEKFHISYQGTGIIALQASNGKFVGARRENGLLTAWADEVQELERFNWCPVNPLDIHKCMSTIKDEIFRRQDELSRKLDEIKSLLESKKLEELFQNAISKIK